MHIHITQNSYLRISGISNGKLHPLLHYGQYIFGEPLKMKSCCEVSGGLPFFLNDFVRGFEVSAKAFTRYCDCGAEGHASQDMSNDM
jgi:hypothetical protein